MKPLTTRDIFRFYLPLVLTSQMMTLSGPLINVAIGRSANPKVDFAGYWLGFAIMLFINSPSMIVQPVATALITGYRSTRRLFFSSFLIGLVSMAGVLLIALTPLGDLLFKHVITTTPRVAAVALRVMLVFSPIPLIIAFRGVSAGIALQNKKTVLIAWSTGFRVVVISAAVGLAVALKTSSGATAGAAAFVCGLALETGFLTMAMRGSLRSMKNAEGADADRKLTFREILHVAAPLAVSAYVWTSIRPVINALLGHLPDPELAQAGFGVVTPIILLTCSPLWAFQNVTLILPQSRADLRRVLHFGAWTALFFTGLILLLTWTSMRDLILQGVFSLSPEMKSVVAPALLLIVFEPVFLTMRSASQGL